MAKRQKPPATRPGPDQKHEDGNRQHLRLEEQHWADQIALSRRSYWTNVVAAGAGIVGLIILAVTAYITGEAADAAKESAEAAIENNKQSLTMFIATNRARIVAGKEGGEIAAVVERDGRTVVELYLRNTGEMAALDVDPQFWLNVQAGSFTVPERTAKATGLTLPAGSIYLFRLSIKPEEVQLVKTSTIQIYGRVSYRDDLGSYCDAISVLRWAEDYPFEHDLPLRICGPQTKSFTTFSVGPDVQLKDGDVIIPGK